MSTGKENIVLYCEGKIELELFQCCLSQLTDPYNIQKHYFWLLDRGEEKDVCPGSSLVCLVVRHSKQLRSQQDVAYPLWE